YALTDGENLWGIFTSGGKICDEHFLPFPNRNYPIRSGNGKERRPEKRSILGKDSGTII
ncbi:hypothetical protein ADUPG1_005734, partial [Aduncisulcus paluster]